MKHLLFLSLLTLCVTVSACQAAQPPGVAGSERPARATAPEISRVDGVALSDAGRALPAQGFLLTSDMARPHPSVPVAKLPANFMSYASQSIGDGKLCVVGAVTDEDGLHEKPIVYVAHAKGGQIIWLDQLPLPADTYQSRATHCNRKGNALFVLLQSDTQPQQTLSQTLLRVMSLDETTGAVRTQRAVDLPGAYTAWVDEGASHFQWVGDELMVSATYRLKSSDDPQASITLRLNPDLIPASGGKP